MIELPRRFMSKVRFNCVTGCWEWRGSRATNGGYGRFWLGRDDGHRVAHRVSFEAAGGVVPEGLELHHVCNNRACVNPAHLRVVTRSQNIRETKRCSSPVCCRGHLREEHSRIDSYGRLLCLACIRERRGRGSTLAA